jgi:alpha-1,3-rhamnosyl/mannosyltransferase
MRIGIDAITCLPGRTGGIETYVRELVQALARVDHAHELVLFAQPGARDRFELPAGAVALVEPSRPSATLLEAFALAHTWLPDAVRAARIDVLHHAKNYVTGRRACPRVLTLHDLFPHYFLTHEPWRQPMRHLAQLALMTASVREADHVIAVCEASARHIGAVTGAPPGKLSVVPHGAPKPRPRLGTEAAQPAYLLCLAKAAPYKNLPRLIRAFLSSGAACQLQIAGVQAWRNDGESREVAALARRSGGRVRLLGFVDDARLPALYHGARALISASLTEGFGLVPLEAAAHGTASALSEIPAHVEVMGDAALFFDPRDERSIAAAIRLVDRDEALCKRLGQRGRARARCFSWRKTALDTLRVYERVGETAGHHEERLAPTRPDPHLPRGGDGGPPWDRDHLRESMELPHRL